MKCFILRSDIVFQILKKKEFELLLKIVSNYMQ